jgi:magnesium-transporting ATPase (P-type)
VTRGNIWHRVRSVESAAIAGVVYAVLTIIALSLLREFPEAALSDDELAAWFDDSARQAARILGLNLASIAAIAFLWFVAVIRRRLGNLEDRFFGTVFLGSAILYLAIWMTAAVTLAAPAVAYQLFDGAAMDRGAATLLGGTSGAILLVAGPRVQAVFVFTTSTLFLRSGVVPRWLAFVGYAMGLVMFIVPLVAEPLGVGFPVWVLIASLTILVGRRRDAPADGEGLIQLD